MLQRPRDRPPRTHRTGQSPAPSRHPSSRRNGRGYHLVSSRSPAIRPHPRHHPRHHRRHLASLSAPPGQRPRTPRRPAVPDHASPRCHRILKDWTGRSARKIHLYGPPELTGSITRWNAEGIFAAARHYLRLTGTLVKNEIPCLAPSARSLQATPEPIATAANDTWAVLQRRWKAASGGPGLLLDG